MGKLRLLVGVKEHAYIYMQWSLKFLLFCLAGWRRAVLEGGIESNRTSPFPPFSDHRIECAAPVSDGLARMSRKASQDMVSFATNGR